MDEPTKQPCVRHSLVGREYDDGCYACRRDHDARMQAWMDGLLTAMQVITVESIFVEVA